MRTRSPIIKDTALDTVIGWFDPMRAVRRRHARTVLALTGGYEGARTDRRGLKEYTPQGGSADTDINYDLPTLRNRSRDLARNNPIGGGAIHTVVNNVVGTGLTLNARVDRTVLGMGEEETRAFEQAAERGFRLWAEECDIERNLAFADIQSLAFRSTLESGDVLILMPWRQRPGDVYGLKLQVIESDRLSNPDYRADSATLSGGVELDPDGAPVRYHVMSAHPGDFGVGIKRGWTAYDAFTDDGRRRVLHLYRKLRPGQHRGVPYLAPVIETLKQLGRYTDAEVMAAVVSGMFTVFIKTLPGEGLDMTTLLAADGKTASSDGDISLGYGAVADLKPGESIEDANPGRPNQAFDQFVLSLCRQIGMALELPYEILVKHFTASYSAARAALLEAWGFYRCRRAWLVRQLCRPVYEAWMWEAVARGYLYAPGFTRDPSLRQAYLQAEWIGPTQGQIDPVKEVQAAGMRLDLKLTTRSQECMSLIGDDWEAKVPQIMREEEIIGGAGKPAVKIEIGKEEPEEPEKGDEEKE